MNLKELAQILDLSQTTVSRALNGYPEVSARTRERVMQAARDHAYRPSRRARSLATGRSRRIAILAGAGAGQGLTDPAFCAFLSGAAQVLEQQAFDWVIHQAPSRGDGSRLVDLSRRSDLEGAILAAPSPHDRGFAASGLSRFPVVVRGDFSGRDSAVSGVDYDHRLAMRSAIAALAEGGHRRIALVTRSRDEGPADVQATAFLDAMARCGLPAPHELVASVPRAEGTVSTLDAALGRMSARPTALVIGCSLLAAEIVAGAGCPGQGTGHDMDMITYDDGLGWLPSSVARRSHASIAAPAATLGREAAIRLVQQIRAPETIPDVRLLAPALVPGSGAETPVRMPAPRTTRQDAPPAQPLLS